MTIKEVEQILEVPRATVRFYEKEGFLNPSRSDNGYREYSPDEITRLKQVIVLRKLGISIADIKDILNGTNSMSEVVDNNIRNLETQIAELKGALSICKKLQENKEELSTFDVDKYWNVIEEEEKKGNHFFDIAKDVARYEKGIVLEHFGIADINGNLSVSLPKAVINIVLQFFIFGIVWCLLEKTWSVAVFISGIRQCAGIIAIECIVKLPIYLLGRKHPFIKKHEHKIYLGTLAGLLLILVILLIFLSE